MSVIRPLNPYDKYNVFDTIRENFTGPYIGTFAETIETGYLLHLLNAYLWTKTPRWEKPAVLLATVIAMFILASHVYYLLWLSVFTQANYANVLDVPWMMWSTIPLSGCVTLIVQSIYAKRLVKLNDAGLGMKLGLGVLIFLCFGVNSSYWATVPMKPTVENIFDPRLDDLMAFFHRIYPWALTNYAWNIFVDLVLCVATWTTLFKKKQLGLQRTQRVIKRFMQLTFQAMIFPTLATIATFIVRATRFTGAYDPITQWSINKLMLISLLHLLLARRSISKAMHIGEHECIDLADLSGSDPASSTDRHMALGGFGQGRSTGTVIIGFKRDSRMPGDGWRRGEGDEASVTPFARSKEFT